MMDASYVIKRPLLTEKSTAAMEMGQYAFVVDRRCSKTEIKDAIESLYGVKVTAVRTSLAKNKEKRTRFGYVKPAATKKATIRLRDGDVIELF